MLFLKILKNIFITMKILILKYIYHNKLKIEGKISFRRGLSVIIMGKGFLKIGKNCFFNNYCSINCLGHIEIGDNCLFGEGVKLYDHNHKFTNTTQRIIDQGFKIGKIKIGNNCWIGSNVTILKDVIIGDNTIIGANCLIYQSIPNNSLVKSNASLNISSIKNK